MKHLRKYESFSEEELYNKWKTFIESLIDNFQEFEDNDWYWSSGSKSGRNSLWNKSISLDFWPEFNCIMLNDKDDRIPAQKIYEVDYTGHFKNGEIIWNTKDFKSIEYIDDITKKLEELEDFIVAIKRLNDATGIDFSFSYNNKEFFKFDRQSRTNIPTGFGDLKIVIRGFVKI